MAFYAFLRQRGWWVSRDSSEIPTHLCLNGGKLCVPEDMHGAFLNAYAAHAFRGQLDDACLVEVRTPVFRLFIDLDLRSTLPDGVWERLYACVASSFADEKVDAIVLTTSPKTEADGRVKRGYHVVWPHVYVTASMALALRDVFLGSLVDIDIGEPWDKVLDASVYRGSGLRMPWSAKSSTDRRVYAPTLVLNASGMSPLERPGGLAEFRELVHRCTIRAFCDATPTTLDVPAMSEVGSSTTVDTTGGGGGSGEHRLSLQPYRDALKGLNECLPVQHAGQQFTALRRCDDAETGEPVCFVLKSTSRWCGNLGRAHNSNTVYFVLTRRGISQRCYCRCDTTAGRKYGLCSGYRSADEPVPDAVLRRFFPPPSLVIPETVLLPSQKRASQSLDDILALSRPMKKPSSGRGRRGRRR